jgi:hypothetical protein
VKFIEGILPAPSCSSQYYKKLIYPSKIFDPGIKAAMEILR